VDEEAGQADFTYTKNDGICGTLRRRWRLVALVVIALLIIIITAAIVVRGRSEGAIPRNVILLIPDGTGFATMTMARVCKGSPLSLDSILQGSIRTYASDSWVTDSAASATAYASGEKTYNGAIGVDSCHWVHYMKQLNVKVSLLVLLQRVV
jgi:alkaline phosphatase